VDLVAELPQLLPLAVEWAEGQSRAALARGLPLDARFGAVARSVGVAQPDLVRIAHVGVLPFPAHPRLRAAARQAGLLAPGTVGLTLGHAILIVDGHDSPRLLSHELRHVHQYEQAGSIAAFLPVYLSQILDFGYEAAPLERDARRHEIAK
jgi:hypothetical protein